MLFFHKKGGWHLHGPVLQFQEIKQGEQQRKQEKCKRGSPGQGVVIGKAKMLAQPGVDGRFPPKQVHDQQTGAGQRQQEQYHERQGKPKSTMTDGHASCPLPPRSQSWQPWRRLPGRIIYENGAA